MNRAFSPLALGKPDGVFDLCQTCLTLLTICLMMFISLYNRSLAEKFEQIRIDLLNHT